MKSITIAALAAIGVAAAVPALSAAQSGPRELTVRMKVTNGAEVRHAKGSKLATGDSLLIRLSMSSPRRRRARHGLHGLHQRRAQGRDRQRDAAVHPAPDKFDDGQIVTAGLVNFSALDNLAIPIVGGSGAYRGATGQVTSGAPVRGFDSVDVLQLDG